MAKIKKSEEKELEGKLTNATIFTLCGPFLLPLEIVALVIAIKVLRRTPSQRLRNKAKAIIIASIVITAVCLILATVIAINKTNDIKSDDNYYYPTEQQLKDIQEGEEELQKLREANKRMEEYFNENPQ